MLPAIINSGNPKLINIWATGKLLIGLGIHFHGRVHKGMAKGFMRELEYLKTMFIEEPVLPENGEADLFDYLRNP